jgi:hypothetical protein
MAIPQIMLNAVLSTIFARSTFQALGNPLVAIPAALAAIGLMKRAIYSR